MTGDLLQAKRRRQRRDSVDSAELDACNAATEKLREYSQLVSWVRRAAAAGTGTGSAVQAAWWKVAAVMWSADPRNEE
jgi:hypothetical protein